MTTDKKVIVVLGMHRSGTSAVTRSLKLLGIELGDRLHLPGFDNPKGYWEDLDCLEINEQLLAHIGSAYDKLDVTWQNHDKDPAVSALQMKAVDLIKRRIADYNGVWGFKDPRTSRLMGFWRSVLEQVDCEPFFVIAVRNPISVALSLQKRNDLSFDKSNLLWLLHNVPAVNYSSGFPRIVIDFDLLMDAPLDQITRIASVVDLPMPDVHGVDVYEYVENFLDNDLRHTKFTIEDLQSNHRAPLDVVDGYRLLFRAAKDDISLDSTELSYYFKDLESRLLSFSTLFSYTDALEDEKIALLSSLTELDRQIGGFKHSSSEQENHMNDSNQPVTENIDILHRSRLALDEADNVKSQALFLQKNLEEANDIANKAVTEREIAQKQSAQVKAKIINLEGEANIREAYILSTKKEIEALKQQVDKSEFARENLLQVLEQNQIFLKTLQETNDYLSIKLNQVINSFSWRLLRMVLNPLDRIMVLLRNPLEAMFRKRNTHPENRDQANIELIRQSGLFDAVYYLNENPDVVQSDLDPLSHYYWQGYREGRNPNPNFDTNSFMKKNKNLQGMHPLVYYIKNFNKKSLSSKVSDRDLNATLKPISKTVAFPEQTESAEPMIDRDFRVTPEQKTIDLVYSPLGACTTYEEKQSPAIPYTTLKLIAFYLPQYHPIPENDQYWGRGFTEWTNTTKALPLFEGHYQPRLPGELGFYDTRIKDVIAQQIALAKQYGIYGFCLHHYFFSGKPVMRVPLNQILTNKDLDIPFCLHWANEPWTTRWDGQAHKGGVIFHQEHSSDDDYNFFHDIEPALRDDRYIRINGRPLILIYRPDLFPNMKETVERWREYSHRAGIGELYLAVMQTSFSGKINPKQYDFDAAVEFPPHNVRMVDLKHKVRFYDSHFRGNIFSYPSMVKGALERKKPDYKLFRGVLTSWDCTPRRRNPDIYIDDSPELYENWLKSMCDYTLQHLPPSESFVFINAWNEWAEGAYLEPDRKYGYAYLNKTASALVRASKQQSQNGKDKVVFIGHDAALAGAQILLMDLIAWIKEHTDIDIGIVLGKGGYLKDRFSQLAPTVILEDLIRLFDDETIRHKINSFCGAHTRILYANTFVSGEYLHYFRDMDAPIISHIHELTKSIEKFASRKALDEMLTYTDHFIACSRPVAGELTDIHQVAKEKISTVYSFIKPEPRSAALSERDRKATRKELGLPENRTLVWGCGSMDWRKGPDLFVDIAEILVKKEVKKIHFYWIGGRAAGEYADLESRLDERGLRKWVSFLGEKQNPRDYFRAGDIFLLSSREDPFPLVCLEGAENRLPIVCFADIGGMPDFVEQDCGFVVPKNDLEAMAEKVHILIEDKQLRSTLGENARNKLLERYTADTACSSILQICRDFSSIDPKVSVIVPYYNHEAFIEQRLDSILHQTFRDFELIIINDASTDKGMEIVNRKCKDRKNVTIINNEKNIGNPFINWFTGIEAAKSELIWLAEDDDYSDLNFLENMIPVFQDKDVNLAYCSSNAVDENNNIKKDFYIECGYYDDLKASLKWNNDYINSGTKEVIEGLAIKNTIPNVSATLMRKSALKKVDISNLDQFVCGGDWYVYMQLLKEGKIAYIRNSMNYHRRHPDSIVCRALCSPKDTIKDYYLLHSYVIDNFLVEDETFNKMITFGLSCKKWFSGLTENEFTRYYKIQDLIKSFTSNGKNTNSTKISNSGAALFKQQFGYCPCCESFTEFRSEQTWLRDHYLCSKCGSLPRERALVHVLNEVCSDWKEKTIHEASPTHTHLHRLAKNYSFSQYYPGHEFGTFVNNVMNQNLENLTFDSCSFSIFISIDVLEHVFSPKSAINEMLRVVKPNGIVIFTAPRFNIPKSIQRAERTEDGNILYLEDEEYHASSGGESRALVTWSYGHDFELLVEEWCGLQCHSFNEEISFKGINGEFLDVFWIVKPDGGK